ncbi:MAG TPA: efflux RND transporter periplasmic adaptor subunit [Anaerolineae bacterium]|nr:efflux RND transporter periplasmic adaptor subunit [Anaerolineae bacterium]HQK12731.1 efflux RND transporter periplasmic adaptor subunit [Anaerolineae bacterium]
MLKKKLWWIVPLILILAGGGYFAYRTWFAPKAAAQTTEEVQTATVTVGDISITATGSGQLVASDQANLAFSTAGVLKELFVEVGDEVKAGAILARIDDTDARQNVAAAEVQVMQAEQALALAQAQAELAVLQAQANLDAAQTALDELLNWEPDEEAVALAQANLTSAQMAYKNALAKAGVDQTLSARISLEQAIESLKNAQESYASAMSPDRDWEKDIETTRANAANAVYKAQQNLEVAQNNYKLTVINNTNSDIQSAKAQLLNAQKALEEAQTPPDDAEITAAQIKVQQMALALEQAKLAATDLGDSTTPATREAELALEQARLKLATAKETLEGTTLVAPFDGTVTAVNCKPGDTCNGTAIVLQNLGTPVLQFWIEEADMSSAVKGNPVRIVFEALPDYEYNGEIYRVDPVLTTVGGTSAVQLWATVNTTEHPVKLLANMNADVEIVAGEALNALLVPVQALRQLDNGRYAVFVKKSNGELEMRTVEIGLMDAVNAEVKSGLERGEVVTLSEQTSSGTTIRSTIDTQTPAEMPPMGGFGGPMP